MEGVLRDGGARQPNHVQWYSNPKHGCRSGRPRFVFSRRWAELDGCAAACLDAADFRLFQNHGGT
jgi:hypothetical protein